MRLLDHLFQVPPSSRARLCGSTITETFHYESDRLEVTYDWFNEHLPCPPFQSNLRSGEWTQDAVAWYRAEATEPIRRMWEIVAILREHGVAVWTVTSERPGKIVYEDDYQVLAQTPYWA
jgi:hypothetical protein